MNWRALVAELSRKPPPVAPPIRPAIIGSIRSPEFVLLTPTTACRNSGTYMIAPNITAPKMKVTAIAREKIDDLNSAGGSTASGVRDSCHIAAAIMAAPPTMHGHTQK